MYYELHNPTDPRMVDNSDVASLQSENLSRTSSGANDIRLGGDHYGPFPRADMELVPPMFDFSLHVGRLRVEAALLDSGVRPGSTGEEASDELMNKVGPAIEIPTVRAEPTESSGS